LPDTLITFNSPLGRNAFPKDPFLKPLQQSSLKRKTFLEPLILSPPSTASRSNFSQPYSRTVRISTAQGTTVYTLKRKEDGRLLEFKPEKKSQTYRAEKKKPVREEKIVHKKTVSMVTVIPTLTGATPSLNLDSSNQPPKSDFFRIVNQMLDRQHFEDKAELNHQDLLLNTQTGKSDLKKSTNKIKKRLSNDSKPLKPEERAIILEYEHEILGNYVSSESMILCYSV